jgi:hypothetical protein
MKGAVSMRTFFRLWFDRASDIAADFDPMDFLFLKIACLAFGFLLGISSKKIAKFIWPFVLGVALFSTFKVIYPRRGMIRDMLTGDYEDSFREFDIEDVPDFV